VWVQRRLGGQALRAQASGAASTDSCADASNDSSAGAYANDDASTDSCADASIDFCADVSADASMQVVPEKGCLGMLHEVQFIPKHWLRPGRYMR